MISLAYFRFIPAVLLVLSSGLRLFASEDAAPDFAREVLPILSDKCFVCHGPDAKKDELRLDSFEGASADLGGYKAIDPESPGDSEVIARIHNKQDPMPPRKAESQLNDSEREILTRWAKSGGGYSKHWAFVAQEKGAGADLSIDSLVKGRLDKRVIDFAKEADRPTLARRVSLILTGLPPEPGQLEAFLRADSADAYERLVDELLASPHFGEHQARYWLDAVRYGDTHGLHLDNRRGIFPYRDWVVKAYNENLPFDQFITWQLAGDLLPDPDLEKLTATGYVRMNPTTAEGGAIPEEFQAKNNFDRVENFGTVFLGMTLNCVRCHTHKYDPLLHREYYELMAFFNSTAEGPMDGNAYIYAPVIEVPSTQEGWKTWQALEVRQEEMLKKISQFVRESKVEEKAIQYAKETLDWKAANWKVTKDLPIDIEKPNDSDWKLIDGPGALEKEKFGNRHIAKWVSFDLTVTRPQILIYKTNAGPRSLLHVGEDDPPVFPALHILKLEKGTHSLVAKLQGIDGKIRPKIEIINPWAELAKKKQWSGVGKLNQILMAADCNSGVFPEKVWQPTHSLALELIKARSRFATTLIAKDLPAPRETRILERGEYNMPVGEPLAPGVFAVMNPFPSEAPKNRLGLAQWLVSADQPLVTRVLVNRIWQSVFGYGLVRSPEDFGLQGKQPTHPELLDWLAVTFREQGWDYKKLMKSMVMSRTFRQDSAWRSDIESDPDNQLLARGPGFRLDAEVIRDTGLWAAGLLETQMGGEGVKPWQPEGMWTALAHPASNTKLYDPDTDDRVNKRSLYVYWKRTSPHPMMTLFDAPSREVSCVRRSRGNTPLQSLGLFNEPQRINMARTWAQQLVQLEAGDEERLNRIFSRIACRPPSDSEKKACLSLLTRAVDRYTDAPEDAVALTQSETADPHLAAWIQLVNTVLASDVSILLY